MSDTCIVCLGDLGRSASEESRPGEIELKAPAPGATLTSPRRKTRQASSNDDHSDFIAHLLPCGHDLHNECLKPWVERANSCPICRQNFNKVELSAFIGGESRSCSKLSGPSLTCCSTLAPIISSYTVKDKVQEAELDPALYIDDELFDDAESDLDLAVCPLCGESDNEEHLLNCDGCEVEFHTYCVDLDAIPRTQWFCDNCAVQRALDDANSTTRPHRASDRRTRSQRRQARRQNQAASSNWARVWQSVWDHLNLDLDFPYDESGQGADPQVTRGQRREIAQWRRRFEVAQRQGGGNRFRDTAAALLDIRNEQDQQTITQPESQEELRAWNAFEKAKEIELDPPTSNTRKRKSAPTSPAESAPTTESERPLKRPRTRRVIDTSESSRARSAIVPAERPSHPEQPAAPAESASTGPSFLQSLLKEVETSAAADETKGQRPLRINVTNRSSPQPSSPGASPTASNHATPRAMSTTPPPTASPRAGSPMLLTSRVEPMYPALPSSSRSQSPSRAAPAVASILENDPQANDFSPTHSPRKTSNNHHAADTNASTLVTHSSPHNSSSPPPPPPATHSKDLVSATTTTTTTPARDSLSLTAKSSLQKIVSAALRPYYHSNKIDKDQYTEINRKVSRMLYEMVGREEKESEGEDLEQDGRGRKKEKQREEWEKVARGEVEREVGGLKGGTRVRG